MSNFSDVFAEGEGRHTAGLQLNRAPIAVDPRAMGGGLLEQSSCPVFLPELSSA